MSKQEFIDRLRAALNGRIPASQIEDTVNYYLEYINSQVRSGKSEAEVMNTLGDPRLIARTIIETSTQGDDNRVGNTTDGYGNGTFHSSAQGNYNNYQDASDQMYYKNFRMPGWLAIFIVIMVLVLLFGVVFSVLSFLAPVIIVIVAVVFLVKLFRDWLN